MNHPFHPLTTKRKGDHVFIYLHPASSQKPFKGVISRIEGDEAIVTWEATRRDVPKRISIALLIKS